MLRPLVRGLARIALQRVFAGVSGVEIARSSHSAFKRRHPVLRDRPVPLSRIDQSLDRFLRLLNSTRKLPSHRAAEGGEKAATLVAILVRDVAERWRVQRRDDLGWRPVISKNGVHFLWSLVPQRGISLANAKSALARLGSPWLLISSL